jgi:gamma-glutamyltranspeptidase / glutathione hydrolase
MIKGAPHIQFIGRRWGLGRQCASLVILALTGCGGGLFGGGGTGGAAGRGAPFVGAVVAEEPRAATVAYDVLTAGGNAADAAVAAYFALSVTYPSAAALGGGGACVVYDPATKRAESLDFAALAPRGGGAVAAPGNVRGMALLQARYGRARWPVVLAPAEQLARIGHPVSRAYARALAVLPAFVFAEPDLEKFLRAEGETLRQPELAEVIARMRAAGAQDFFQGQVARQYAAATAAFGGRLEEGWAQGAPLAWRSAERVSSGPLALLYAPTKGGAAAAELWAATVNWTALRGGVLERAKLADAVADGSGGATVIDAATTAFAAIDRDGLAAACVVSMGQPFGVRRVAKGLGVLAAPAPGEGPRARPEVHGAALLAVNLNVGQTLAAATATGGRVAAAALVQSLAPALLDRQPLAQALAAPRLYRGGAGDPLYSESGVTQRASDAAVPVVDSDALGRVGLLVCADGAPRSSDGCRAATDRRGFGLAIGEP